MMSLAGNLYSEQPFAYRYKSEYVEGCSCRQVKQQSRTRSAWQEVSTGTGKRIFLSDISAGVPRRTLQPSRGGTFDDSNKAASLLSRPPLAVTQLPSYEDPDTLFNLEKGFDVTVSLNSKTMANGEVPGKPDPQRIDGKWLAALETFRSARRRGFSNLPSVQERRSRLPACA